MKQTNIEETNVKDLLKRKSKLLITLAVVLAVLIVGIVLICVNSYAIEIEATYLMMPKTISADESDLDFDLHIRKNSDYDLETQSSYPLEAFEYYYTDPDTGEEVVIKGTDSVEIDGEEVSPYIVFLYKAYENLATLNNVIKIVIPIIIVLIIVLIIFLWYRSWSKRQDAEKLKAHKKSNNNSKKKSKKQK